MAEPISSPIQATSSLPDTNGDAQKPEPNDEPETKESSPIESEIDKEVGCENIGSKSAKSRKKESNSSSNNVIVRRERPTRACTARPAKYVYPPVIERRPRPVKREKVEKEVVEEVEEEAEGGTREQCSKIVTALVNEPTLEQMPRWKLRSMWELASVLNFFNVS